MFIYTHLLEFERRKFVKMPKTKEIKTLSDEGYSNREIEKKIGLTYSTVNCLENSKLLENLIDQIGLV